MGHSAFQRGTLWKAIVAIILLLIGYVVWIYLWAGTENSIKKVSLGRDACHECGMIISDVRFSVSIWTRERGRRETYHFDDVGCFLRYLKQHAGATWEGVGHDFESKEEVALPKLFFMQTKLSTPMASGWVAVRHREKYPQAKSLEDLTRDLR